MSDEIDWSKITKACPEGVRRQIDAAIEARDQLRKLRAADEPDTPETIAAKFSEIPTMLNKAHDLARGEGWDR